jgi:hypothetical protein
MPHKQGPVLICSSAHLLFCSSAHLLFCSSAHLLICSSALLLICSSAHMLLSSAHLLFCSCSPAVCFCPYLKPHNPTTWRHMAVCVCVCVHCCHFFLICPLKNDPRAQIILNLTVAPLLIPIRQHFAQNAGTCLQATQCHNQDHGTDLYR